MENQEKQEKQEKQNEAEWGKVDLILDDYMKENGYSRSSLSRNSIIHYAQLLKYCENEMQKVDLNLLARICKALNCGVGDILKYTPPKKKNNSEEY